MKEKMNSDLRNEDLSTERLDFSEMENVEGGKKTGCEITNGKCTGEGSGCGITNGKCGVTTVPSVPTTSTSDSSETVIQP